jgi:hypothetical protein
MIWPDTILELENRFVGDEWQPTLGRARHES